MLYFFWTIVIIIGVRSFSRSLSNFTVISFTYRLTPLIGCLLSRHFNCKMRKPFIWCCTMPMLHFCRNIDAVTWLHFYSFFTLFLIVSSSGNTYQDLPTSTFCMMDMPVISALNWTPYSQSLVVTGFNSIHVCALCELFVTSSFARLFFCFFLVPNLFCKVEYCPSLRPSCIECCVGDNCCDFFLCYSMILCIL